MPSPGELGLILSSGWRGGPQPSRGSWRPWSSVLRHSPRCQRPQSRRWSCSGTPPPGTPSSPTHTSTSPSPVNSSDGWRTPSATGSAIWPWTRRGSGRRSRGSIW